MSLCYHHGVRVWLIACVLVGCHPSATIEHTTPVANLKTYRAVGLRVQSSAFAAQGQAQYLENAVTDKLRRSCGFEAVGRAGDVKADVVLDLNITRTGRGDSTGLVSNENLATIETMLVLSDGQTGELLGTARIKGKSSGIVINNETPELEAIDVVAKTIADTLVKSGCSGKRVAKAEPPPPPPPAEGTPPPAAGDETKRAEAEKLNEQGKEKLRGADLAGALGSFQQAVALIPDARYQYNVCLTFEAQEQWANAVAACKQARGMNAEPRLVTKIDHRLDLLKQRSVAKQ